MRTRQQTYVALGRRVQVSGGADRALPRLQHPELSLGWRLLRAVCRPIFGRVR